MIHDTVDWCTTHATTRMHQTRLHHTPHTPHHTHHTPHQSPCSQHTAGPVVQLQQGIQCTHACPVPVHPMHLGHTHTRTTHTPVPMDTLPRLVFTTHTHILHNAHNSALQQKLHNHSKGAHMTASLTNPHSWSGAAYTAILQGSTIRV